MSGLPAGQRPQYLSPYLAGWLSYWIQRVSLAGLPVRLAFLTLISVLNVLVGACLYRLASGQPWSKALFKTYGVLFRAPGIGVMNEDSFAASIFLNTIFIFGLFVFATFLGMISDGIKQQVHAIRIGQVQLPLHSHVVVLGWNQQSLSLLRQLSAAQSDPRSRLYNRAVVVLAETSKAHMDSAVAAAVKGSKLHVFSCSGRPTRSNDLHRVAAHAADTVIILQPDTCSSSSAADALQTATLVSLVCLLEQAQGHLPSAIQPRNTAMSPSVTLAFRACMFTCFNAVSCLWPENSRHRTALGRRHCNASMLAAHSGRLHTVVQVRNSTGSMRGQEAINFFQEATSSTAVGGSIQQVQLLEQTTLDRLVCQTAAEPGVAAVFRELVRSGGDVRLLWIPVDDELVGSYGHAAGLLHGSIVLGVLSVDSKQLTLNPPDQLLLQPGDQLVGLTRLAAASHQVWLHTTTLEADITYKWAVKGGEESYISVRSSGQAARQYGLFTRLNRTLSRVSSMASPQLCLASMRRTSSSGSACSASCSKTKEEVVAAAPLHQRTGRRILLLGWQEDAVPAMLKQLREATPKGSSITVLLPNGTRPTAQGTESDSCSTSCSNGQLVKGSHTEQQQSKASGATAQQVSILRAAAPCSMQSLCDAGISEMDAVIVGSALCTMPGTTQTEADALVTSAMLAIQQAVQQSSGQQPACQCKSDVPYPTCQCGWQARRRLHVVAVVSSYSVRRVLQTFLNSILLHCWFSYEIMVLEEFAAGMLVSVAEDLHNSHVIHQLLLQPWSCALSMWDMEKLGTRPITFSAVQQAARQLRCTALGYRSADGRLVLAPDPEAICEGEHVVMLDSSRKGHRHS